MLSFSSGAVIVIGSYSLFKCLRKRSKSVAKMAKLGGKALKRSKSTGKPSQVHPL